MAIGIIGRKAGMTRVFTEDGVSVPVTVIEVEPNRVTQVRAPENDGYSAVQVTVGEKKGSRLNKPAAGHFAKAGVEAGRGLWEFRLDDQLVCVAVTDFLHDGLSALYTFFDPGLHNRGLGTFAILWQIEAAKRFNKQWVYLGYWINESDKMAYKTRFKPYELFINGYWQQGGR